ncbi:hypothetical protein [Burkholderia ambifaria]|uniref:Uncharacterized protein n=1 Tax=Burkholderia ambifaria (strain ATCC BAA-244 / DSM 16087 / CCUG 44356 / LMG 19182 / AMMD) TaxID=339670 RepID=Q0BHA8_BURCM|nr:hypothetical protein [Burkholderia ambifaria]ABI86465.1 hypothetical protein Bamb_0906 [Burkholderia ambifaria AMMD]MBR7929917.1 hypothetical protein [Burkholderia ambifaria]QQC03206.1 hypothetical protein I6H84_10470 [Burkholderia ambifaria]UZU06034.1 hypothetical protein OR987_21745 [Burkholderia ambifaria]UZU12590.1 hypothetical protein OR988_21745 [Burkholderia ambifaria]
MNAKSYSINDGPFNLVAAVLHAICRALPDDQRLRIAGELRDQATRVNEDAETAEHQQFALDLAALADLAQEGPDAASSILSAGQPR